MLTHLLHDAVPSSVRTGFAAGAGAISWMVFLRIALVFGVVRSQHDVQPRTRSSTTLAAALLVRLLCRNKGKG